jgi:hypothetical protein
MRQAMVTDGDCFIRAEPLRRAPSAFLLQLLILLSNP